MPQASPGSRLARWLVAAAVAGLGAGPCAVALRLSGSSPADTAEEHGLRCSPSGEESVREEVTAIIASSPRPEDATGRGLEVLRLTVQSLHDVLGLAYEQVVVAFDAVPHAGAVNDALGVSEIDAAAARDYAAKLAGFETWNAKEHGGAVTVFKNSEWTHQLEMVRRVFSLLHEKGKLTPVVFLGQDDSFLMGPVNTPLILHMLGCDPGVDVVRFLWAYDCYVKPAVSWNMPCKTHPNTTYLQSTAKYSDRPHFAKTDFIINEIFSEAPRSFRNTPEQFVKEKRFDTVWLYGERNNMFRELNLLHESYNKLGGDRQH